MPFRFPLPFACGLLALSAAPGRSAAPSRPAAELVAQHCAQCHGRDLVGNPAPNLLDNLWTHGGRDEDILRNLRAGFPAAGMPAFEGVISEPEMREIIAFLRRRGRDYAAGLVPHPTAEPSVALRTEKLDVRLETVVDGLATPWGIAFLPDGRMLVSEREGRLRIIADGRLDPRPVEGLPTCFVRQDGGLLDVMAHPRFAENGWVYLAYCEAGAEPDTSMTVVVRGRIVDGRWRDQQDVFRAPAKYYYRGYTHYGCRFLFDRTGHLLFTIGDRGRMDDSQDLSSPCGKVHRVRDDGSIPPDNPLVNRPGAWPSLWTWGNRHPQGLQFHPVTGELWATEHGPTGGDELNRLVGGSNYGWPLTSRGRDRVRTFAAELPGMVSPVAAWSPSVAPAAIEFYAGDRYPAWSHHLFIACLGGERLLRLELDGARVVHEEVLFRFLGRVRDVVTGPDGLLYLAMNTPGRIARLVPEPRSLAADGAGAGR